MATVRREVSLAATVALTSVEKIGYRTVSNSNMVDTRGLWLSNEVTLKVVILNCIIIRNKDKKGIQSSVTF